MYVEPVAGPWDSRILAFRHTDIVTTFAVLTREFVALIDTMLNPRMAAEIVSCLPSDAARGRPLLVVNTHADWDHCWGNALFAGSKPERPSPILGHAAGRERLRSGEERERLDGMRRSDPGLYADVDLVPPTIAVAGGTALHGGDLTLHLLATPGHTRDHLSVWIPELSSLFAGDAAEYPIPFVQGPDTLEEMLESLRSMRALRSSFVLYCHGAGRSDASVIDLNLAYFEELQRRLAEATLPRDARESDLDAVARRIDFDWGSAKARFGFHTSQEDFYRRAHRLAVAAALGRQAGRTRAWQP